MRKPRRLRSGDRVAVVAPASPFDRDVFDRGIGELQRLGYDPVFNERVFDRERYLAGSAARRAESLTAAWADPAVAGIFSARGGYGSAQLLPLLDPAVVRSSGKPFIGCSDLTALLVFLTNHCGTVGFHGPMLVNLADGEGGYDRRSLVGSVSMPEPLGELAPDGVQALRSGEAHGILLGGTLTQLLASLSTPYTFAPPDGYVLLLDDVGERPYRVDRMLTQLVQSGLLRRASAVVCAEFPGCSDADGCDAREVIASVLSGFDGPVLFGFPTGHSVGPLWTLPLGVNVRVQTDPTPRVVIEESAVR